MAPFTPLPCPDLCVGSFTPAEGSKPYTSCPICRLGFEPDQWRITHTCGRCFCLPCTSHWVEATQNEYATASCPMCRGSLGRLSIASPTKTWVVLDLDELSSIVGEQALESPSFTDQPSQRTPWEEIDCENTDPAFVGLCPISSEHQHEGIDCPVSIPSILAHANEIGQLLSLSHPIGFPSALLAFHSNIETGGVAYAISAALSNPWVQEQLQLRRQLKASLSAFNLLFDLNFHHGVRFYRRLTFPTYDPDTTFYLAQYPTMRAVGTITELRRIVASRRVYAGDNQTGEFLITPYGPSLFTTAEIQAMIDPSDDRSTHLLATIPHCHDVEAWAVWKTDDRDNDLLYAIPRILLHSDLPLREPESFFLDDDGKSETRVAGEIDRMAIPPAMNELYDYDHIFKPQLE